MNPQELTKHNSENNSIYFEFIVDDQNNYLNIIMGRNWNYTELQKESKYIDQVMCSTSEKVHILINASNGNKLIKGFTELEILTKLFGRYTNMGYIIICGKDMLIESVVRNYKAPRDIKIVVVENEDAAKKIMLQINGAEHLPKEEFNTSPL